MSHVHVIVCILYLLIVDILCQCVIFYHDIRLRHVHIDIVLSGYGMVVLVALSVVHVELLLR